MQRWRECCAREWQEVRQTYTELAHEVMDVAMGSPPALLRLHRLLLLEAACALCLLSVQVVVFLACFLGRTGVQNMAMLVFIAVVPILATVLRLPVLVRMNHRCAQLARASEYQNAAVATGMVQLLRSGSSRCVQVGSAFLICWYAFGVSWNYIGEPCRDITEPIRFWKIRPESAPCESWETICTLLLLANSALGLLLLAAPGAVAAFQGRFLPSTCRGIPAHILPLCLPEQTIGANAAPGSAQGEDGDCSICIEPMLAGEMVRRLPCGHCFHRGCADSWLTKSATCPMRCRVDLWGLVRAEQPDAPLVSEPEAEAVGMLAGA